MSTRAAALALAAVVLGGCAAPDSLDATANARQADRSAPVVNYPLPFAPAEPMPVRATDVILAPRGDDFFVAWLDELGPDAIHMVTVDAHGKPTSEPAVQVAGPSSNGFTLGNSACSPAGDCVVVALHQALETVRFVTFAGDGTVSSIEHPQHGQPLLPLVAYDPDSSSFLVVWNDNGLSGIHVAGGSQVESMPFPVLDAQLPLLGLACAPGSGCLANVEQPAGATTGVLITAAGVGAPFAASAFELANLTYGGGVYFSIRRKGSAIGVVRQDLDGASLDAAPLPIAPIAPHTKVVLGAGFDGTAFDLAVTAYDQEGAKKSHRVDVVDRFLPDGTAASPATFDLGALDLMPGFACGSSVCEVAASTDASGAPAFSVATVADGSITPGASDLDSVIQDQRMDAALAIGGRVFAVWHEGSVLRTRWFTSKGEADGEPRDLDETNSIVGFDADGDRGLLVFGDATQVLGTRVVSANGDVGPFVPDAPPAKSRRVPARFGVLRHLNRPAFFRYDADGNVLDPSGVEPDAPNVRIPEGQAMARAGDTFVLLGLGQKVRAPTLRVTRVRDTGEIIDASNIEPSLLMPATTDGLSCSSDLCLLLTHAPTPKSGDVDLQVGLFEPKRRQLAFRPTSLGRSRNGSPVFDGRHFLVLFSDGKDLDVVRLDEGEPATTREALQGQSIGPFAAPGDGNVVLFASRPRLLDHPTREVRELDVWSIRGEGFAQPTGSGGAGGSGGGSTSEPPMPSGCSCREAAATPDAFAALIVAAALAHARRRRRRAVTAPARLRA